MPMLTIWPVRRMVPTVAEATPRNFFSTALIMELVLGDENSPKPVPRITRLEIIYPLAVALSRN